MSDGTLAMVRGLESLELVNGVWTSGKSHAIESEYLRVREKEGRLLSDDQLVRLPFAGTDDPQRWEWMVRARSWLRLRDAFGVKRSLRTLEVGCGNGWLSARLANEGHVVTGIDTNLRELEQAARVFLLRNLTLVHLDIAEAELTPAAFDRIVFAASIQYVQDPRALFSRLFDALAPGGEIHIIDSPFYRDERARATARERSRAYYRSLGEPNMAGFYHHHLRTDVQPEGMRMEVRRAPRPILLQRLINRRDPGHPHVVLMK